MAQSGGHVPVERPIIKVAGDLADITRASWAAIEAANDPPFPYHYGGLPVRLEREERGGTR